MSSYLFPFLNNMIVSIYTSIIFPTYNIYMYVKYESLLLSLAFLAQTKSRYGIHLWQFTNCIFHVQLKTSSKDCFYDELSTPSLYLHTQGGIKVE